MTWSSPGRRHTRLKQGRITILSGNNYLTFCLYFQFQPIPASPHVISLYCQYCRTLTPQSIRNYISGVRSLHFLAGYDFPLLQSFEMRVTLKGIARFAKHTPIRAPPITLELLLKVISVSISRILGRSPFSKHFSPFSCLFAFRILYPCRHPSLISHYICAGEIFSSSRVSFWFCSNGLMNAVYSYLWYPFREASFVPWPLSTRVWACASTVSCFRFYF